MRWLSGTGIHEPLIGAEARAFGADPGVAGEPVRRGRGWRRMYHATGLPGWARLITLITTDGWLRILEEIPQDVPVAEEEMAS